MTSDKHAVSDTCPLSVSILTNKHRYKIGIADGHKISTFDVMSETDTDFSGYAKKSDRQNMCISDTCPCPTSIMSNIYKGETKVTLGHVSREKKGNVRNGHGHVTPPHRGMWCLSGWLSRLRNTLGCVTGGNTPPGLYADATPGAQSRVSNATSRLQEKFL